MKYHYFRMYVDIFVLSVGIHLLMQGETAASEYSTSSPAVIQQEEPGQQQRAAMKELEKEKQPIECTRGGCPLQIAEKQEKEVLEGQTIIVVKE